MHFVDEFPDTVDELDAVGTDDQGAIVSERRDRTDLNTTATISSDFGAEPTLTVNRLERVDNFDAEQSAAESLVAAYNRANSSAYTVKPKDEEDSEYEDRILISTKDVPHTIGVQIRHLDDEAIRDVGQRQQFTGLRSIESLVAMVRRAISVKAQIDPRVRSETILLLHTPALLGPIVRRGIAAERINSGGFREVWLSSFREEALRLD